MSKFSDLDDIIEQISEKVVRYNSHRRLFQNVFYYSKYLIDPSSFPDSFDIITDEKSFAIKVKESKLTGLKIVGVDGGVLHRELNFFDIALVRAVAVMFYYKNEKKPTVFYYPSEHPLPDILTSIEPLKQNDIDALISLWRMQKEIKCALNVIESTTPTIIILDGSVFPNVEYRQVAQNTYLSAQYARLKALYRKLYVLCQKKRVLLCGVVKDSRSAILTNKLSSILPHLTKQPEFNELLKIDYRSIIKQLRDTDLLFRVLDIRERTFHFLLSRFNNEIDKDLPDFNIYAFYIKTAEYDTPLRVEFPGLFSSINATAQKIASIILAVSTYNLEYGMPNVIVEADGRARLQEIDADLLIEEIAVRAGYSSFSIQKRRSRTPFVR